MSGPEPDDLLKRLEERARESAGEAEPASKQEIRASLGLDTTAPDLTLGGYIAEHDRPPAFEGTDGNPYSVAIEVEETGDSARPFVAFLIFLRWADTGAGVMDHVESDDVAVGTTKIEAEHGALDLSLYEVKTILDQSIARRRADMEG